MRDEYREHLEEDILNDIRIEQQSEEEARQKAYASGLEAYSLRKLVQTWSEELMRVELSEVDPQSAAPKQGESPTPPVLGSSSFPIRKPNGDVYPVRVDESQRIVWLRLDGAVTDRGYRNIEVLSEPLNTDRAAIAMLTALEGPKVRGFEKLPKKIRTDLEAPLKEGANRNTLREVIERSRNRLRYDRDFELLAGLRSLDYPLALLRDRRPGFDELPYEQQLAFLKGACDRIHTLSEDLRKLMSFLEFATFDPEKGKAALPNRTSQQSNRYLKAAVLKDVEKLTYKEIARRLDVPIPKNYQDKRDIPAVRELYEPGRDILKRVLGEEGWEKQAEAMRTDMKRWDSLGEEEKVEDAFYRNAAVNQVDPEIERLYDAIYEREW